MKLMGAIVNRNMNNLPSDLFPLIVMHLTYPEIIQLGRTCTYLYDSMGRKIEEIKNNDKGVTCTIYYAYGAPRVFSIIDESILNEDESYGKYYVHLRYDVQYYYIAITAYCDSAIDIYLCVNDRKAKHIIITSKTERDIKVHSFSKYIPVAHCFINWHTDSDDLVLNRELIDYLTKAYKATGLYHIDDLLPHILEYSATNE